MSTPFLGEIKMAGFNFAPRGYATCDGQILSIQQNTALFSILGTNYGGNGQTTFGLPDLRSRAAMSQGSGPGLTPRNVGERNGEQSVALTTAQMPAHNHTLYGATLNPPNGAQNVAAPTANAMFGASNPGMAYSVANSPPVQMASTAIGITGQSVPHENRQPFLTINMFIALQGIFPSRN